MTRPDYCPAAQEPCQSMCGLSDVRCQIRDDRPLRPADEGDKAVYQSIADNYKKAQAEDTIKRQAQKIAELTADRDGWIEAHARLHREYHDFRKAAPQQAEAVPPDVVRDAERWRTFLATRPANTHAVINDAIDAAMAKGEKS